jgi:hypothetical protein
MSQSDVEAIIDRELPGMHGWCTIEKAHRLAALARDQDLCVELGVFGGRSLAAIALGVRDGRSEFGRVDGIDPFTPTAALEGKNDPENDKWWGQRVDYEAVARSAQEALYRLDLVGYARLIRMRSVDVVGFYGDGTIDLLHQDSNHSEEVSCNEVELWAPKVRAGGYWVADDADWPTTQKAQADLIRLGFETVEDHKNWKVYRKT